MGRERQTLRLLVLAQSLTSGPAFLKLVPQLLLTLFHCAPPRRRLAASLRTQLRSCFLAETRRSLTVPGGAPVSSEISSTVYSARCLSTKALRRSSQSRSSKPSTPNPPPGKPTQPSPTTPRPP